MKLERLYSDRAFTPPRRRVKVVIITRTRAAHSTSGLIPVENEDTVGAYPILWSRPVRGSEGRITEGVMLSSDDPIETTKFTMDTVDFNKLDETDIEW